MPSPVLVPDFYSYITFNQVLSLQPSHSSLLPPSPVSFLLNWLWFLIYHFHGSLATAIFPSYLYVKALGLDDPTSSVPDELWNPCRKGHVYCPTLNSGTSLNLWSSTSTRLPSKDEQSYEALLMYSLSRASFFSLQISEILSFLFQYRTSFLSHTWLPSKADRGHQTETFNFQLPHLGMHTQPSSFSPRTEGLEPFLLSNYSHVLWTQSLLSSQEPCMIKHPSSAYVQASPLLFSINL